MLARAWVVWPAIVLLGGQATPGQALCRRGMGAGRGRRMGGVRRGGMAACVRRAEERHRASRLLFPAGLRQRVAAGHVLHTAPQMTYVADDGRPRHPLAARALAAVAAAVGL